jgi:hypothetical protein
LYVRNWIYHLLFYSSTPLEQSSNHPEYITVDRYGIFTANFRLPHQLTTGELFTYLTGAISAVGIIGASLVIPGWWRGRKQRRFQEVSLTHLKECIKMIDEDVGKSHVSLVYFMDWCNFYVASNVVLATEINHFLCLSNSADDRPCKISPSHNQCRGVNWCLFLGNPNDDDRPV